MLNLGSAITLKSSRSKEILLLHTLDAKYNVLPASALKYTADIALLISQTTTHMHVEDSLPVHTPTDCHLNPELAGGDMYCLLP